jgi:hypothetical protein
MIKFGGDYMNDKYWEYFKEYKSSGMTTEQAILKAHEAMYEGF